MRTPKEYTQNLKQKIITKQMLADCLYSVNKRAKNCRDNEHKYSKYRTDYYGNADNYRQQKEEYYSQKDKMLTLLKPNCIHETTEYHKEHVYDYEPEYYEIYDSGNYLRSSGYYDKELHEYVEFVVVNVPHTSYYLFYDLGTHSFHTPIEQSDLKKYPELQVVDIGELNTYGEEITELVSNQFVAKLMSLIRSGDFRLVFSE